jgi:peptide chain release factor
MSNILLCITAGRGPVECLHAVKRVLEELCLDATRRDLDVNAEPNDGSSASFIVSLDGVGAEAFVRSWERTIQWIAKSKVRKGVERKNWFVAVKRLSVPQRMPELTGVKFKTLRAGGPGGQHQNKTESAVRATHVSTGTSVVARYGRSQYRNKALAIRRLQQLLATINERHQSKEAAKAWLKKIDVERGSPVRIYEGPDFVLRQGE